MGDSRPGGAWIRRLALSLLGGLTVLVLAGAAPRPAAAQNDDASLLIALVNQVRAEYGLPPYRVDPALMAAAQSHTEWEASVGTIDHVGEGGTRPADRAVAAGYGSPGLISISENIYFGTGATPQDAINWWRNSQLHLNGMISTRYQDIGAGAVYADGKGYFTLLFGVRADTGTGAEASGPPAGEAENAPPAASGPPPIEVATPRPDGSIVHVVQLGEIPWNIAQAYGITLEELYALNGLPEDAIIYEGQELLIRPADTPTPEPSPTPSPAALAALPTRAPTATPRPAITPTLPAPSPTPSSGSTVPASLRRAGMVAFALIGVAGVSLIVAGIALGRKHRE
ncbi:MAG TPA: LysM peptidoglycan-binding domain-containing protein [Chloroflexi bacterium]|nr:LysM peptidoglycan-binding domain-containing protein [Chloroflexota bacterium]